MVIQERNPRSLREWLLVKQHVDAELEILRFGHARKWVFNAAVAGAVLRQIVDRQVEREIDELRKKGGFRAQGAPAHEQDFCQGWWRRMKRLSFAAVSGESDAVQIIEKEIGGNKIGFGDQLPWKSRLAWISTEADLPNI